MQLEHLFARDETLPSWWANAIQKFLSVAAFDFQIVKVDATHIQVPAGANDQAAAVSVEGSWRFNEAALTVAHPGGAAGAYPVFVTAAATNIQSSPAPYTDDTNYAFGLQILAPGSTPTIVAGTVDIYRQVGVVTWDGAQITGVRQSVPNVPWHGYTHATGGVDPITPAMIGAASSADLAAEAARAEAAEGTEVTNRGAADTAEANARVAADNTLQGNINTETAARQAADTAEANARVAGDANNPTAAQAAALAGTSGAPGVGNKYVTDADARNANARTPTAHATSHEVGGADELFGLTDAQVASANKDGAAGTPSMRTLGAGAAQAAAGNDSRIVNAVQAAAPTLGLPVLGRPGRIYRAINWSVPQATFSPFNCDVLDRDDDALFEAISVTEPTRGAFTAYQFKAPVTGWYQFEAFAETSNVGDTERFLVSLQSASASGALTAELARLGDISAGATTALGTGGAAKLYVAAGSRVAASAYVTAGPAGMSPTSATVWMTAQRVG